MPYKDIIICFLEDIVCQDGHFVILIRFKMAVKGGGDIIQLVGG